MYSYIVIIESTILSLTGHNAYFIYLKILHIHVYSKRLNSDTSVSYKRKTCHYYMIIWIKLL